MSVCFINGNQMYSEEPYALIGHVRFVEGLGAVMPQPT